MSYKEELIGEIKDFQVDVFIKDTEKENINVNLHWHDCFEILYVLEGNATQHINDKEYQTKKGDLVLIKKGDLHATHCNNGEIAKILVIKFLPEILNTSFTSTNEIVYVSSLLNIDVSPVNNILDNDTNSIKLCEIISNIHNEFHKKEVAFELSLKGHFYVLLTLLIRSSFIKIPKNKLKFEDVKILENVTELIHSSQKCDINLKAVAKSLSFNYSYFSRYFKKISGKSFCEYANYIKILDVERMVLINGFTISKASLECGFDSYSSFAKTYKKIKGYSPSLLKSKIKTTF